MPVHPAATRKGWSAEDLALEEALEGARRRIIARLLDGARAELPARDLTPLLDAVRGVAAVASGCVELLGREVTGWPPHRLARVGLTRTFQSLELFDDLTVRENLRVAVTPARWGDVLVDLVHPARRRAQVDEAVDAALEGAGVAHLADRRPGRLSNGERHAVALARALVGSPRMVLLDEPAAGLDPDETSALGAALVAMAASGTAVLLVDHDMDLVLGTCERVHVLAAGRLIASGTPDEVRADAGVLAAYLGDEERA